MILNVQSKCFKIAATSLPVAASDNSGSWLGQGTFNTTAVADNLKLPVCCTEIYAHDTYHGVCAPGNPCLETNGSI